jgi:hypothetical protein
MIHRFESYDGQRGEANGSFTDAELWLEPHVWRKAVALLDEASTLVHASAKPPRTKGTIRASLNVAAFRMRRKG